MDLEKNFIVEIKSILFHARQKAYTAINSAMVEAYWLMGKRIVEEEQHGKERAAYGKGLLKALATELSAEFGKGFDERELRRIRQFYQIFPIRGTLRPELSWCHYRLLIRITSDSARDYYLTEAANNQWSYRTLERNSNSLYYQRLLSSQVKQPVIDKMMPKTEMFQQDTLEFIKNPYVLEFLQLPCNASYKA